MGYYARGTFTSEEYVLFLALGTVHTPLADEGVDFVCAVGEFQPIRVDGATVSQRNQTMHCLVVAQLHVIRSCPLTENEIQ